MATLGSSLVTPHDVADHRPEPLALGTAPRPTTGRDLADRLTDALRAAAGGAAQGLDRARINAMVDGADVTSLEVDLTGVVVGTDHRTAGVEPWHPQVQSREEARVHRLRLDAHPLMAVDLPVDVIVELEGLRFAWVEGTDGRVGVEPLEPSDAAPVAGHARVAVDKQGLIGTAHGLLAVALASQGVQLVGFDLDVRQQGPRAASLVIDAKIRRGFISASAQATASASIDEHMVLTVGDIRVSSGNPFVSALLGAVRGRIEAAAHQRIDLAEALPPGVHLADVRLDVGQQIVITARLGG
jgi:hypothetical protein